MSRKENRPQFRVATDRRELLPHPLTLAECLVGPARVGRPARHRNPRHRQCAGHRRPALALARLRADTSLRMPDCCVLAAALETGASLATFDATLARVASERGVVVVA